MAEKEEKPRHFAWLADPNAAPPRDEGPRYFSHLYDKKEPGMPEKTPSLDDALKSFSQRSPLDDALEQFATASPLDDALRSFAAEKKPPPWAPVRPPPAAPSVPASAAENGTSKPAPPSPVEAGPFDHLLGIVRKQIPSLAPVQPPPEDLYIAPTHAAHVHMKTVLELIEEADAASDQSLTSIEALNIVRRLRTAAEHLVKARSTNPDAKILVTPKKGDRYEQTIDDLAVRLLRREGLLCVRAAARWEGDQHNGHEFLTQARDAFLAALRYRPSSSDLNYQLAESYKLLGERALAIAAANKALVYDESNTDAVRFLHDAHGAPLGTWTPLWRDEPEEDPLKEYYIHRWLIAIGLVGFVGTPAIVKDDTTRLFMFVPAIFFVMVVIGCFIVWQRYKTNRAIDERYRDYASARSNQEVNALLKEIHEEQYQREKEERRRSGR